MSAKPMMCVKMNRDQPPLILIDHTCLTFSIRYEDRRRGGGTKSSRGRQKFKYKVKKEQKVSCAKLGMDAASAIKDGACILA